MIYKTEGQILNNGLFNDAGGQLQINDVAAFRETMVDNLVETIIMGNFDHMKKFCYWVAYNAGLQYGVVSSSIQGLYDAMGKGAVSGFTVPAMNIRTLTYDIVRSVFRAAGKINAGAFIFEIAKSEIGYTDQRPLEYSTMIILAAIKEGYKGPIFIQGDHFQVKAKKYLEDAAAEVNPLQEIIKEAIDASFYNIDIDTSTLVDLEKKTLDEQQKLNYEVCSQLTQYIRALGPRGVEISVGGEIGEVGGKNSTSEELHTFAKGYWGTLGKTKGISKISIQTGTSHGGVVLPDGSIAKVSIDFDTLRKLSEIARRDYHMAGAVQHGASTLPNEAFHHFPEVGCAEIHLATQFQNIVYEYLPISLKEKIYAWLHTNCASEKKPGLTDDQFIYKTRKSALGPFKKEIFGLPAEWRAKISGVLEKEFSFLFEQLNIKNTKALVDTYVSCVPVPKAKENFLKEEKDLGDLEGAD
ncbi:MAG: class II fructose-bisphosphate aldolase [Candidatus Omnitrophota bacterium]